MSNLLLLGTGGGGGFDPEAEGTLITAADMDSVRTLVGNNLQFWGPNTLPKRHLVQQTDANRWALAADPLGDGREGFTRNGSSAFMQIVHDDPATYTVFTVETNTNSPAALSSYFLGLNDRSDGIARTDGTAAIITKHSGATSQKDGPANWGSAGTLQVYCRHYGGTHATDLIFIDGVQLVLPSVTAGEPGDLTGGTWNLFIGSQGGTALFADGVIRLVYMYSPSIPISRIPAASEFFADKEIP